jgi:hypothetical protein
MESREERDKRIADNFTREIDRHQKFDNKDRHRFYGKRRGDIVESRQWKNGGFEYVKGEVEELGFMDNNCIYVKFEGSDKAIKCVAEWCYLVTKVEDREDYEEGTEEG